MRARHGWHRFTAALGLVWRYIRDKVRLPTRARVLWYGPFYLCAAITLVNAGLALVVHRDIQHAITAATLALLFALWSPRVRTEFRRGWDTGFVEGCRMARELNRGDIPPNMIRVAMTGDPAPEPWDAYPYRRLEADTDTADDAKE